MRRIGAILDFGLVRLTACGSLPTAAEIAEDIVSARSADDNRRIADYFSEKANSYETEVIRHKSMYRSYISRPKDNLTAMATHCKSLQEHFSDAAKSARALEDAHRQLAVEAGKRTVIVPIDTPALSVEQLQK